MALLLAAVVIDGQISPQESHLVEQAKSTIGMEGCVGQLRAGSAPGQAN